MIDRQQLKDLIDRPNLEGFDIFNTMFRELSLYMNQYEIDQIVDFMYEIENSKFDINPSISDTETQLQIILGKDRYRAIVDEWKKNNQTILTKFGTLKYKCKKTNELYDGLDATDNPDDYEKVYV
jgi:hypothetical protein